MGSEINNAYFVVTGRLQGALFDRLGNTPAASLEERVAQQKNQQRARAQLRVARRTRGEV
jgi:hypothetical protein